MDSSLTTSDTCSITKGSGKSFPWILAFQSGIYPETTMLGEFRHGFTPFNQSLTSFSLGLPRTLSKTIRRYFSDTFGPFNLNISIKNHTLLLLDAPGLVEEDYQRAAGGKQYEGWDPVSDGAVEFVKRNSAGK
jgi:hypothetical protein